MLAGRVWQRRIRSFSTLISPLPSARLPAEMVRIEEHIDDEFSSTHLT
jgi:hypothetical protein